MNTERKKGRRVLWTFFKTLYSYKRTFFLLHNAYESVAVGENVERRWSLLLL